MTNRRFHASRRGKPERRTAVYTRVSTADQAENGVSLDAQEERTRALCIAKGFADPDVYRDEGASAKDLDRPELARLLAEVSAGRIGTIVVAKLDRLTRSVRDLSALLDEFARKDVALLSVSESIDTSSAAGRMLLNLLATVAQWEREAIGERTSAALAHKRAARKSYGPTPYGYRRVGDILIPRVNEQKALTLMRELDSMGVAYWTIAQTLTERGFPPRGRQWYASSVIRILRSRMTTENVA